MRQAEILRAVSQLGRPNLRAIADRIGSPNRLRAGLEELVHKRCLRMDLEGNQHRFTITKTGLMCLAKYDGQAAGASIASVAQISRSEAVIGPEDQRRLQEITGEELAKAFRETPELIEALLSAIKMLEDVSGHRVRWPSHGENENNPKSSQQRIDSDGTEMQRLSRKGGRRHEC